MLEPLALAATGVSKRYGTRDALNRVDLRVAPGQLHGLLGPNGAGKTTLMRVVLGLVRRDAGSVHVAGRSIDAIDGRLPDGVAGFVDAPGFYPYLTGRTNLELLCCLDGERAPSAERIRLAMDHVGLGAHADRKVSGYSAGMRQRLALCAAVLRSPRLLLLDEPTSSLDPAGAREVRSMVRRLADEGAAVLLSSHDMGEVEALCSDLTVLAAGRVVFSGTIDALRQRAPHAVHTLRTSDDAAARTVAVDRPGLHVAPPADGGGLDVWADVVTLDAYVIALGSAGIAVRRLERRDNGLESLFLELTQAP